MHDISEILKVLREASNRLPQLRFAWGLLGISSVAAIITLLLGSNKSSIVIIALTIIGVVIVFVITVAFGKTSLAKPQAMILTWAITILFVTFLGFTISAFAFSWPCNWVKFLDIPGSEKCNKRLFPLEGDNSKSTPEIKPKTTENLGWQTIKHYQVKDGLVKDTKTSLMWMRCSLGQRWNGSTCKGEPRMYQWQQSLNLTKNFSYAGYMDWRLPTHHELKTLTYNLNSIKKSFPNIPNKYWFWSSSRFDSYGSYVWIMNYQGKNNADDEYSNHIVRLVRDI